MNTLLRSVIRAGVYTVIRRLPLKVTVAIALVALALLIQVSGARAATVAPWTVIEKASDESVSNSAVLQADDALTFTTTSGAAYEIEATVIYASPAGGTAPDVNALLYEDATARGTCSAGRLNNANSVSAYIGSTASSGSAADLGTDTANRIVKFDCTHVGAGGSFGLYWSQRTSSGNASTVRAGSQLRYRIASDDYASAGGSPAWADVTGKPDFTALYCDADGTEADPDCAAGSFDPAAYYTRTEVDGIAELASDTCGGPSLPACEVELSADDREAAQGAWWGTWAIVGLLFALILAPRWFATFRVTQGG